MKHMGVIFSRIIAIKLILFFLVFNNSFLISMMPAARAAGSRVGTAFKSGGARAAVYARPVAIKTGIVAGRAAKSDFVGVAKFQNRYNRPDTRGKIKRLARDPEGYVFGKPTFGVRRASTDARASELEELLEGVSEENSHSTAEEIAALKRISIEAVRNQDIASRRLGYYGLMIPGGLFLGYKAGYKDGKNDAEKELDTEDILDEPADDVDDAADMGDVKAKFSDEQLSGALKYMLENPRKFS